MEKQISKRKSKKLFVAYTLDEYELPLYVTPYVDDMAEKMCVSTNLIYQIVAGTRSGRNTGLGFEAVYIDEE